ncbi:ABC transporter permease [Methanoplanus endosymbiosus]|uniref:Proline/glycine betaine ABC transporter permease n=1 Tax=Methanoplanus endosymbiosus TaxID=33865 RepID=A0A9E7THT8_9EURY|nr:proline/glycine betaine ABC transporter permease [Methanoplanus endosymbiosus]UUX91153.1 proline/glycine betaine ABC transporter permease [Methanoplanus endosymbiosus]
MSDQPAIPKLPIGEAVEAIVDWIQINLGWLLDGITAILDTLIGAAEYILTIIPPVIMALFISGIMYFLVRRKAGLKGEATSLKNKNGLKLLQLPIMTLLCLLLIWDLQLWDDAMETLALVIVSAVISLVIGIPIGILSAKSERLEGLMRVFLDFMQTMPSFVYLIPAVIFFGLGEVPGVIATVIFSMPPAIRLTELGIRQIPKELVEVADAFGAKPMQKLIKVELPVAMPTIMAGVNQCIMLALSMTVIASMIGAGGLGYQVLYGIQRVDIGTGFEAGLAIVIIAIILDRLTQNIIHVRGQQG